MPIDNLHASKYPFTEYIQKYLLHQNISFNTGFINLLDTTDPQNMMVRM